MSKNAFHKFGAILLSSIASVALASAANYAPGEVIVTYKSLTQPLALKKIDATLQRFSTLSRLEGHSILFIHSRSMSTQELIDYFKSDPNVLDVHPNYIYHLNQTPDDTYFGKLWAMKNTGQEVNGKSGTAGADINATKAWDVTTGSKDYVVAILDTGVDYKHEDLKDNIWSNSAECNGTSDYDDDGDGVKDDCHGYDFAADDDGNDDSDPMPDTPVDDKGHYHGTHVAGTVGAVGNNGTGVTGVNWSVTILPVKVFRPNGYGYEDDILQGIDYVAKLKKDFGVNIVSVNASYGGGGKDDTMKNAIKSLGDLGILFVAAAGNDGTDNDQNPSYPASYDLDNIIAVAATDQNDQLTSWSNYGKTSVDLAAPGDNILSTYPRDTDGNSQYAYLAGTSMATPHVTGSVALVWDALANKISGEDNKTQALIIKRHILADVDQLQNLKGKVLTGGRLDLGASVHNHVQLQQTQAQTKVNKSVTIKIAGDNGTDREGDALTVQNPTAQHGTVVINNGDESLTYTPETDWTGTDQINVDLNDSLGDSAQATVSVTVKENHAPTAVDDHARVQENHSVRIDVLQNDSDEDGDSLSLVAIAQAPQHGNAQIDGNSVIYTPDSGFTGSDTFRYTVSDGDANVSAAVTIEVYASQNDNNGSGNGGGGGGSAGNWLSLLLSLMGFLFIGSRRLQAKQKAQ